MASPMKHAGHVLILMLFMLGVLAELALSALQIAASSGLQAQQDERRLQRQLQAEAIVSVLASLPVPRLTDDAALPWHPVGTGTNEAFGATLARKWWWRIQRLPVVPAQEVIGTDTTYFQALKPQIWQLEVMVAQASGHADGLSLRFQQQVRP